MSPKDKRLQVRIESDDMQKLQDESERAGFRNIAEFVRYMTIGEGRSNQKDLKQILEILEKSEKK